MNKFFNILLLSALTLPFFTACESDTDSNPVFHEATEFVLNEPAYAANNTYDLGIAGTTVQLTCNQPDYGFPVATTYAVQVTFDESFEEENYIELGSTFTNTHIAIEAAELNSSLLELWSTQHEGEDVPTEAISIYVRLRAVVSGQNIGKILSNTICLSKVKMNNEETLSLPEYMWLAGTMSDWSWVTMAPVYGLEGQYYRIVYLEDGGSFKFGTKEGEWLGYNDSRLTVNDNANAGVSGDNNDGNIQVTKGGYYLITMKTVAKGNDYAFTMNIAPAKVYIIGACEGGNWALLDEWMFTDKGNGILVSPALVVAGEVRMCVDAGIDWWRTEFTLKSETEIHYRNMNIIDSWTEAGADYSIAGAPGMVIELNFNAGTGEVKK